MICLLGTNQTKEKLLLLLYGQHLNFPHELVTVSFSFSHNTLAEPSIEEKISDSLNVLQKSGPGASQQKKI